MLVVLSDPPREAIPLALEPKESSKEAKEPRVADATGWTPALTARRCAHASGGRGESWQDSPGGPAMDRINNLIYRLHD